MSAANGMLSRVEVNQRPHRTPAAAAAASATAPAPSSAVAPFSSSSAARTATPATAHTPTQHEAALAAAKPTAAVKSKQSEQSKQTGKSKRTAAEREGEKTAEEQIALLREVVRDATEQLPLADADQLSQLESVLRRATKLLNALRDSHH